MTVTMIILLYRRENRSNKVARQLLKIKELLHVSASTRHLQGVSNIREYKHQYMNSGKYNAKYYDI